jgi:hypothetical protein
MQYGVAHTYSILPSNYWVKHACTPTKLIASIVPGLYHLRLYSNQINSGDRKELYHSLLDFGPVDAAEFKGLVRPLALGKYVKSHLSVAKMHPVLESAIELPANRVGSLTICLTPEQPGLINDELLTAAPAVSIAKLSDEPVLLLLDGANTLLASSMTLVTHGGGQVAAGMLTPTPIHQRIWDKKKEPKYLPGPEENRLHDPVVAERRRKQLFAGAPAKIPRESDIINRYEIESAAQEQHDREQKQTKQQQYDAADQLRYDAMPSLPVNSPIEAAAAVTPDDLKQMQDFKSVMLLVDLRMKLRRMETETMMIWGAFVIVAVGIFIRALDLF